VVDERKPPRFGLAAPINAGFLSFGLPPKRGLTHNATLPIELVETAPATEGAAGVVSRFCELGAVIAAVMSKRHLIAPNKKARPKPSG
jgi:hypothetical protein